MIIANKLCLVRACTCEFCVFGQEKEREKKSWKNANYEVWCDHLKSLTHILLFPSLSDWPLSRLLISLLHYGTAFFRYNITSRHILGAVDKVNAEKCSTKITKSNFQKTEITMFSWSYAFIGLHADHIQKNTDGIQTATDSEEARRPFS